MPNAALTIVEIQRQLDDCPFHRFLQMQVTALDAERQRLELYLPFRPEYRRMEDPPQLHGGPIASLIDIAGTYAMWASLGIGVPTINLRIDYLRPAVNTGLRAAATVRRAGRTIAVLDIEVHDDDDRLVAIGRGTYGSRPG